MPPEKVLNVLGNYCLLSEKEISSFTINEIDSC